MSDRFEGRVAIVTGAASGIGRATALRFGSEKAILAISDRDQEGLEKTAQTLSDQGASVLSIVGDIRDWSVIDQFVDATIERFGRVDVLFNCAGGTSACPTHDLPERRYRSFIALNLDAVFHGCQKVLPVMVEQGGGVIVNVSSVMGVNGDAGVAAYGAAKAGVINFTRCLAVEYGAKGVRANVVIPGAIASEGNLRGLALAPEGTREKLEAVIPMRRFGEPDEVANTVAFLASDEASFINGSTIAIDGGQSARLYNADVE
ncbi:MAG: SDR family NAD(P)-dependent oxidoreductase [Gammaproteobacteria bacterium]|nr:SDR family NAD(P)-dependent oxidoreductase [Gammaproteobacteria bacterium]MDD9963475.1 SDR family NAD(P)-dependent oxidoreductase [Gammaproteobacteria bacterium]MDE0273839.1 SDR family NAD(P)-dependent oxidoreductase [Gammaproteobacteria bacterium]